MSGARRVIVGASGSPGSLRALRYAEDLARLNDAPLIPVLAWIPPGGDLAERRSPSEYLRRIWEQAASQRLSQALAEAWGVAPAGLIIRPMVVRGEPGPVLVDVAGRGDDLLVVGAGRRGWAARLLGGRVSGYCLRHACCPVLMVPPATLGPGPGHGLRGWAFRHRELTLDRALREWGRAAALRVGARLGSARAGLARWLVCEYRARAAGSKCSGVRAAVQGRPLLGLGDGMPDADPLGGRWWRCCCQRTVSSGGASLDGFFGGPLTWPGTSRARLWQSASASACTSGWRRSRSPRSRRCAAR